MPSRFWVGGTGTTSDTAHWATTSGGAGGASVPTAADDVFLDGSSGTGTVTLAAGFVGRSLNCTGYTGTLSHPSALTGTLGDATAGAGSVALKLVSGMTYSVGGTSSSAWSFVSTSTTQQTIDFAGKTSGNLTIDGVGCSYLLAGALTAAGSGTITLTRGTLNTGNLSVTYGVWASTGSTTRTLTAGTSSMTFTATTVAWNVQNATNSTISAGSATITISGAGSSFLHGTNGGGNAGTYGTVNLTGSGTVLFGGAVASTFVNITRTGTAAKTDVLSVASPLAVSGAFTVNSNSSINRVLVQSNTPGTVRTITAASFVATNVVDFMDITGAGAATWTAAASGATSLGDAGGNSGITFTPALTLYRVGAGGNWSASQWALTSGGATGQRVPLPQDTVMVDANASGTITADMPRLGGSLDLTGFAGTLTHTGNPIVYGSLTLASGMTFTQINAWTFSGRGSHTFTSAGKTFAQAITLQGPGGTYTLQDALTTSQNLTVNDGTFTTNNNSVTCSTFVATSGRATTLNLGSSAISLTSTAAAIVWSTNTAATVGNPGTSNVTVSTASANTRTIALGTNAPLATLTYTVAASAGALQIQNTAATRSIGALNIGSGRTVTFFAGSTTNITGSLTIAGASGSMSTLNSSTGGTRATISAGAAVTIDVHDVTIVDSNATGGAGFYAPNSTDGGNNTGWVFNRTPVSSTMTSSWVTRALGGDTSVLRWDTRTAVSDTTDQQWAVRNTTSDQVGTPWSVRSTVSDQVDERWRTASLGGDQADLRWDARAAATDALDARWGVRATTADELEARWGVRVLGADEVSVPWSTRGRAGDEASVTWDVRELAGDALSAPWSVRQVVSDDEGFEWGTRVLGVDSADLRWDAHALVSDDLALSWALTEHVVRSIALAWSVRNLAAGDAGFLWTVVKVATLALVVELQSNDVVVGLQPNDVRVGLESPALSVEV